MMRLSSIHLIQPVLVGIFASLTHALTGCGNLTAEGRYSAVPVGNAGETTVPQVKAQGIQVSAEENTYLSSPNLGVVVVTFKNSTDAFVRISGVSIESAEPLDSQVSIPLGEEIVSWGDAINTRDTIRAYNRGRALGYYTFSAAVLSSVESFASRWRMLVADVTLKAAESGADKAAELAQLAKLVPSEHLLAGPFLVPPQLSIKKWILLKSAAQTKTCITRVFLSFQSGNEVAQRLLVPFRVRGSTYSEWQENQCTPLPPNELGK